MVNDNNFLQMIFPTPILVGRGENEEINNEIVRLAEKFRDTTDKASLVSDAWNYTIQSSNRSDYDEFGVTSFNQEPLFNLDEWKNAAGYIHAMASTLVGSIQDLSKHRLVMDSMWTTLYPHKAYVPEHIHSNSSLSGIYYVKVPEGSNSNLVFRDPSYVAKLMTARKNSNYPYIVTLHDIVPKDGMMVIFPSWLPHYTKPNEAKDDRIIISFNIDIVDTDTTFFNS